MIIGIESSCDESAIAVFAPTKGIIFHEISSQIELHAQYGGVVPELASREHFNNFPVLIKNLANLINIPQADYISVTYGPGLAGCLATGIAVAKTLSMQYKKPLIGINHLRGHALSPFLTKFYYEIPLGHFATAALKENFSQYLPHLGLLVSGGNTLLFIINADLSVKIVAQTIDDASGEAFDKGAKLLGMPYPGGRLVEKLAINGDSKKFQFPRAFHDKSDMKFSFSGLKTSLRYFLEKLSPDEIENQLPNICASYQAAIVEALGRKVSQAITNLSEIKSLGLSGGVSNNKLLRAEIEHISTNHGLEFLAPAPELTGDNAAMIAFAAYCDIEFGQAKFVENFQLQMHPNLSIE